MGAIDMGGAATLMKRMQTMLRSFAEVGRLSNLPTIVSNVIVGCTLGSATVDGALAAVIAITAVALCLMYVGGMALNDVLDASHDSIHATHRPIPEGRLTIRAASIFALACFALGAGCLTIVSVRALMPAGVLLALIFAYDILHRAALPASLLMGLCRAFVYITAAYAAGWHVDGEVIWIAGGALFIYIAALTIIARSEHGEGPPTARGLLIAMLAAPIAVAVLTWERPHTELIVVLIFFFGWTVWAASHLFRKPPQTRTTIEHWLAGICLLDAIVLSAQMRSELAALTGLCFLATIASHRTIRGS